LDYIEINARAALNFKGIQYLFRDTGAVNPGISEFRITSSTDDLLIWNVTDITNVSQQELSNSAGKLLISLSTVVIRVLPRLNFFSRSLARYSESNVSK
jgi:hypothetical protein